MPDRLLYAAANAALSLQRASLCRIAAAKQPPRPGAPAAPAASGDDATEDDGRDDDDGGERADRGADAAARTRGGRESRESEESGWCESLATVQPRATLVEVGARAAGPRRATTPAPRSMMLRRPSHTRLAWLAPHWWW